MKIRNLLFILFVSLITGCRCIYVITINKDGSAHVENQILMNGTGTKIPHQDSVVGEIPSFWKNFDDSTYVASEEMNVGYDSPIIRNYIWTTSPDSFYVASYDIDSIDSLGLYTDRTYCILTPTYTMARDSFVVYCPPGDPTFPKHLLYGVLFIDMTFNFPYKISSVDWTDKLIPVKWTKKTLTIKTNVGRLFNSKTGTRLVVKFK